MNNKEIKIKSEISFCNLTIFCEYFNIFNFFIQSKVFEKLKAEGKEETYNSDEVLKTNIR